MSRICGLAAAAVVLLTGFFAVTPAHAALLYREVVKVTASDAAAGDRFGGAVSLDGGTFAAGAYRNDDFGTDSGAAYVYYLNQGGAENWGEVLKLTALDGAATDFYGVSVAVSGDTLVVGATQDDDGGYNSGSVYVYYRDQGGPDNWGFVTKLTASDAGIAYIFGNSVAIDGDTIVVGSIQDYTITSDAGSAYVFQRDYGGVDNWGQVRKLTASDPTAYAQFGISVSVSGDTIVVGADGGIAIPGAAYIFGRNQGGAGNWGQEVRLDSGSIDTYDRFGYSVAVSGDTVAVYGGYVYRRDEGGPGNWGLQQDLDWGSFLSAVSLDGDAMANSSYLSERKQGHWRKLLILDRSGGMGDSASLSGSSVAFGAMSDADMGSLAGAAYVFEKYETKDFNGDMKPDLLWRNYATGENYVWHLDGTDIIGGSLIDAVTDTDWHIVGTGDFNQDGRTDIAWRNHATGGNYVWYMDGANVVGGASLPSQSNVSWSIDGVGDIGGDEHPDLYWRSYSFGSVYRWYMEDTNVTSSYYLFTVPDTDWHIDGMPDFNGDGVPDLLWRHHLTGENYVWYRGSGSPDNASMPGAGIEWTLAGTSDFNNDGRPDILWRNYTTGDNYIWYMDGVSPTGGAVFPQVSDTDWHLEN